jgi:hypothetical protein
MIGEFKEELAKKGGCKLGWLIFDKYDTAQKFIW